MCTVELLKLEDLNEFIIFLRAYSSHDYTTYATYWYWPFPVDFFEKQGLQDNALYSWGAKKTYVI